MQGNSLVPSQNETGHEIETNRAMAFRPMCISAIIPFLFISVCTVMTSLRTLSNRRPVFLPFDLDHVSLKHKCSTVYGTYYKGHITSTAPFFGKGLASENIIGSLLPRPKQLQHTWIASSGKCNVEACTFHCFCKKLLYLFHRLDFHRCWKCRYSFQWVYYHW